MNDLVVLLKAMRDFQWLGDYDQSIYNRRLIDQAIAEIERLEKENAELRAALLDIMRVSATQYDFFAGFIAEECPQHSALITRLQEQRNGDG